MHRRKYFLLSAGSALLTGLFTPLSVFASDLPQVSEPIEYVVACDAYGAGYFQLPGKQTCVSISGRIRTQIASGNLLEYEGAEWSAYARGYIWLNTVTPSDFGKVSTFAEIYYTWKDGIEDQTWDSTNAYVSIETESITSNFGLKLSEYHSFLGYAWMQLGGLNWAEHYPVQATVIVPLGALSFSASVEDASYSNGEDGGLNYIGALNYSNGMGNMRIVGAIVDSVHDDLGYAVNLNTEIKPVDGLSVTLGGGYMQNASGFVYLTGTEFGDIVFDGNGEAVKQETNYFDSLGVSAWSVYGGVSYALLDDVDVMFEASYLQFETDNAVTNFDGDELRLSGSVVWSPTSVLSVAFAAGYSELNISGSTTDDDIAVVDSTSPRNMTVGTRVQYTF